MDDILGDDEEDEFKEPQSGKEKFKSKKDAPLIDASLFNPYELALLELIRSSSASPRLNREKKINFVALFAPACEVISPRRPSMALVRKLYENRFTYLSPRLREIKAMQASDGDIIVREAFYSYDAALDAAIFDIAVFLEKNRESIPLGGMGSSDLMGFISETGFRKPVKVR